MKNRFLRAAASAVLTVLLVLTLLPQRALAAGATLTVDVENGELVCR